MILATNNPGKLREIKEILKEYQIFSLKEKGITIDVVEDQDTFLGNAAKKAKEIYEIAHEPVLADDSGLCVVGLNDFPGVLTHRFLGEDATDEERNKYLIEQVNQINDRRAYVICNLVYYDGDELIVGEGRIDGVISHERRGSNGFGFDEIFELQDGQTLAELTSEEKNIMSARYFATMDLKRKLIKK